MAIEGAGEGYFTAEGMLKAQISSSTAQAATVKADTVEDQVAEATSASVLEQAAAITEAAVVDVSNRMGATGSGFADDIFEIVNAAVTSALRKLSGAQTVGGNSMEPAIGGTYQNELIANAQRSLETAKDLEKTLATAEHDDTADSKIIPKRNSKAKKGGGSYQNQIIEDAKKSAQKSKKDTDKVETTA
jgi:hypothetical protein